MLFRVTSNAFRPANPLVTTLSKAVKTEPQKRFASNKELKTRLQSVGSIQKITNSMKLIAVAKMKRSEAAVRLARDFSNPILDLWPESKEAEAPSSGKHLYVPLTVDRGLCGSVNTTIARNVRNSINKRKAEQKGDYAILVYGEKGRGGLERAFGKQIEMVVSEARKVKRFNFKQASELAEPLINAKYDSGELVYNRFKNLISFVLTRIPLQTFEQQSADLSALQGYPAIEGTEDMMRNLYEFRTGLRVWHAYQEMDATEMSARMSAMGNATKAAGDMSLILRKTLNRQRQAKITAELCEIISGASGVEAEVKRKKAAA